MTASLSFLMSYFAFLTLAPSMPSGDGLASAIFDLFDLVADWLSGAFSRFVGIFWSTETGLTFLGVLAVMALAIGVSFLILGVIQQFLHFRG